MGPAGKAPDLLWECTYRAQIQPPLDIGPGPIGHRMIFPVTEGEVVGERLNGVIHAEAESGSWPEPTDSAGLTSASR